MGCVSYEVLPGDKIRVYELLKQPDMIAEALVQNDVRLYSMKTNHMNLEDYFIGLIGGDVNA